ncbi:ComEC family competence protein [Subsaximicrobium wynnwilliamsii]|uniref:ComEC family competence protein n=1 Tax=Subsaximicrobium wynnwilliamsii TaxID=291179 RepID=A0A5C6ZIC2_9FLAO|nr:ComEC/Rec2 family competence protein [Subsaximicrobium wynnwilliamsii]TXD83491.1 ComEC family competence protein [Subsaximicrobium wynnwilliamsii]TXD89234.1 ComEC family competence protein [Subsaximicrobium wynnwilliamsii]TXE03171.1 ComEC family competence protein [Subsaximicrobium wynnwilliamsii]
MKLLNFTIIKLTVCLVLGILLAEFLKISVATSLYLAASLMLGVGILYVLGRFQNRSKVWFGALVLLATISLGILSYNLHNQSNFEAHYGRFISEDPSAEHALQLKIRQRLKPSVYHDKYVATVLKVGRNDTKGKILVNIEKDTLSLRLKVDDVLLVSSGFTPLTSPLNPNQFDYKDFLRKQYIDHQLFTEAAHILPISSKRNTIYGYAAAIRLHINQSLKTYDFSPEVLAIINALILGQRQDMSKAIYDSYTNAGAIHILAVSGLHVGLILLLLSIALKPLEHLKHGRLIKAIFIVMLLWSFAVIAGLSASVTRAVTMFSIVAIAMHWKRPTNIYNTLAISMFLLLLFKPTFLFDVGFQLSYTAVFAIVSIQPLVYRLWRPKWKVLDYPWQIFTVTLAAQLGVAPLSMYYFHQFPSLFFISNLAIIPFLGFILGFGILVIILASLKFLPQFLAEFYGGVIDLMNFIVAWVSKQEAFLFKNVPFDGLQVVACYALLICLVIWYRAPKFKTLSFALVAIVVLQMSWLYTKYHHSENSLIVFHKSRHTLLGIKTGSQFSIAQEFDSTTLAKDHIIENFKVGNFIKSSTRDSVKNVYAFRSRHLLVVDSTGIYGVQRFKPDYVLLRNSPRINLNRLIDSIQPKMIIADGSNYKSYVARWKATCTQQKLPIHITSEQGAFVLK